MSPRDLASLIQQLASLIQQLSELQSEIDAIAGPEVDAVVSRSGETLLLSRAQNQLRLQDALQQRQIQYLTAVLNTLPVHIAVLDRNGDILTVNERWQRFAQNNGHPNPLDWVGQNYLAAVASDPQLADELRRLLDGERPQLDLEYPCHSPEQKRWYLMTAVAVTGCEPLRAVVLHADVSETKLSQQKLSEQAALLDHASDAIVVSDLNGTVTFWSHGAEAIYGWSKDEALGQNLSQLILGSEPQNQTPYREVLLEGAWAGEAEHTTRNGQQVTVYSRLTLVRQGPGNQGTILSINSDFTETKRLQERLLRNQRLESLGTLAGGIAHDLNNVLAPILMSVELLRDKVADSEGRDLLKTVTGSAKKGADLVQRILTFARGVTGRKRPVNLEEVVQEIHQFAYDTFPKRIALELKVAPGDHFVLGDATHLFQVLMNLCVNARDAMPEGGTLSLTLETTSLAPRDQEGSSPTPPSWEVISVQDTGFGMSEETQHRVFEPFFTTKEPGHGTGLGLSTVFTITRDHGGAVEVESQVGRGSRFKIALPKLEQTEELGPFDATARDPAQGSGEHLLFVDDEENIRETAVRLLRRHNYRVTCAANGVEAWSWLERDPTGFDAVITDLGMPQMDGLTLVENLRATHLTVPVIVCSGQVEPEEMARFLAAGVEYVLNKPYQHHELLAAVQKVLPTPPPAATEPRAPSTDPTSGRARAVLLVDDEEAILKLLDRALSGAGYRILRGSSAEEGWKILEEANQEIDLVLTDLAMPGMGGVEFAKKIQESFPQIKVIISSGFLDASHPQLQGIPLLPKPYTVDELKSRVREILET